MIWPFYLCVTQHKKKCGCINVLWIKSHWIDVMLLTMKSIESQTHWLLKDEYFVLFHSKISILPVIKIKHLHLHHLLAGTNL